MSAQQNEVAVITRQEIADQRAEQRKLVPRFAERYGVDADKLLVTLRNTAFKQSQGEVSNEQMMALLVVADQYHLNPFTREIYAFPDKHKGIVPIVGVDGWARIINEHPQFDGMNFRQSENIVTPDMGKPCPEWIECIMHRKDRAHPTPIREYLDEVYRPPYMKDGKAISGPWQTHTKRFLRHKTLIQAARITFGFVGIYDPDEAERIVEAQPIDVTPGQEVIPAGKKVGPKKLRETIDGALEAVKANDGKALLAIWNGMDSDQQLFVWGELRSWERSGIKKLLDEAKKADAGMQLDDWSVSLLHKCETEDALQKAFKAIAEAYEANGVYEVPERVQLVCDEMRMKMGAA
jgi:phage recombination protein Bet